MKKTPIELLAPARDAATGRAAILHGADAVYIGADRFGARAAAGNSMQDIEELCRFAHLYHARVYLALNTLLGDHELEAVRSLVEESWNAGVDAIIFQDMALLQMDLPPIALHASTQMHNVEPDHIAFLESAGVSRVVLARELDLRDIGRIGRQTGVELEVFVHGALCVSYSGRCWMSLALGGRSANRGVCGQPCRLPWRLVDERGGEICRDRHLLSLKDLDRSGSLPALLDAGVTSFKIEGRLKDMAYVKNITAFYRQKLDRALEARDDLCPASHGRCAYTFMPDPAKTFHRGGTEYGLSGDRQPIWNMDTPKALGERVAVLEGMEGGLLILREKADVAPGDGLCFLDRKGRLQGLKANRCEGKKIWPSPGALTGLASVDVAGSSLYRNHDVRFRKLLDKEKSSTRKLPVAVRFKEDRDGFLLEMKDLASGCTARAYALLERVSASNPDAAVAGIRRQLEKLGDTPFVAEDIRVDTDSWLIRASELNGLRRKITADLMALRVKAFHRSFRRTPSDGFKAMKYPHGELDASFNVLNRMAGTFYEKHGAKVLSMGYENGGLHGGDCVMITLHCLRYALGACPRHHGSGSYENWRMEGKERVFTLVFDCVACRMRILLA
ncbi:U32 family peptidase [Desulfobotulus sp. H1]|uniref:U32 family peptidase n=1 Tax=Desulfobotulus pelophilus TaxID=2823377 RepID=A0ABT3N823_9BACT|nr:U32 family peptidase [Desulfobotulus pelophilus]MCW7753611.1 U32 family peptidase [Desulfobotulus pelophilus]